MIKMITLLTTLLLFSPWANSEVLKPTEQSWSDYLIAIESDPSGHTDLIHNENHLTNAIYDQSKNKAYLNATLAELFNRESVNQTQVLSDKSEIRLVDHGVGKATELIWKNNLTSRVLLSNLSLKKNNSVALLSFTMSPDEKIVIVFSESQGSIDDFNLNIIEISSGKIISSDIIANGASVNWTGPEKFVFTDRVNRRKTIEVDILSGFARTENLNIYYLGNYPVLMKCQNGVHKLVLNGAREVTLEGLTCSNIGSRIVQKPDEITVVLRGEPQQIVRYAIGPDDTSSKPNKLFEFDGVLKKAEHLDSHFFIQTRWGADQKLMILNQIGKLVVTWPVPIYASIIKIQKNTAGQSVDVHLSSAVVADQTYKLNYSDSHFEPEVSARQMLTRVNSVYTSEVVMIPARDGVLIPTRITKLASSKFSEQMPVLMAVYGGFDKDGMMYPAYNDVIRTLFLNKGGAYVTPAIRGGDEYGNNWHLMASGAKKLISLYDMIDVADYLIKQKWTSAQKIITTGTSNGGFTVAAAALLSPHSFGLVIPVSGVYDILAINRLDPRFASGWWTDYGNPDMADAKPTIKQFSPLELVPDPNCPQFLFVNGLDDSRVNSLHSIKMLTKLRLTLGNSDKINAVFLKNAGHWIASSSYQDFIAVRENELIWTFIYRQLGW